MEGKKIYSMRFLGFKKICRSVSLALTVIFSLTFAGGENEVLRNAPVDSCGGHGTAGES